MLIQLLDAFLKDRYQVGLWYVVQMVVGHLVALGLFAMSAVLALTAVAVLLPGGSKTVGLMDWAAPGGTAIVSGGLGLGLLYYLWWVLRPTAGDSFSEERREAVKRFAKAARSKDLKELRGITEETRPWEVRDEWRDPPLTTRRGSVGETKGKWRSILIFVSGLIFAAVGTRILWAAYTGASLEWVENPAYTYPYMGTAALVGGMVFSGIWGYRLWRRIRFRETVFDMEPFPGIRGGPFAGTVHTPLSVSEGPEDGFRVQLSCYKRTVEHDQDHMIDSDDEIDREVHREVLWQEEKRMEGRQASDRLTLDVPVYFEIPRDCPHSTPVKHADRIMWVLEVSADLSGVDYSAVLEVPVFPAELDESVDVESYAPYEVEEA